VATHDLPRRNGERAIDQETDDLFSVTSPLRRQAARTIRDAIGDLPAIGHFPDHSVTDAWPEHYSHVFKAISPGQKLCNVRHAASSVYTWQIPEVFGRVTSVQRSILETISKHRRHKRYGDIPNGNPLPKEEIEELLGTKVSSSDISALLNLGYLKQVDSRYDLKGAMFCSGLFKRPLENEPSPTVLTNFHNPRYFLHPTADRPFSLRECARLQGFPDNFEFVRSGISIEDGYRLVGNAVPPPLGRVIAKAATAYLAALPKKRTHKEVVCAA
jgi:DNA (cytosine-5)-methyltransferase 1